MCNFSNWNRWINRWPSFPYWKTNSYAQRASIQGLKADQRLLVPPRNGRDQPCSLIRENTGIIYGTIYPLSQRLGPSTLTDSKKTRQIFQDLKFHQMSKKINKLNFPSVYSTSMEAKQFLPLKLNKQMENLMIFLFIWRSLRSWNIRRVFHTSLTDGWV